MNQDIQEMYIKHHNDKFELLEFEILQAFKRVPYFQIKTIPYQLIKANTYFVIKDLSPKNDKGDK